MLLICLQSSKKSSYCRETPEAIGVRLGCNSLRKKMENGHEEGKKKNVYTMPESFLILKNYCNVSSIIIENIEIKLSRKEYVTVSSYGQ